MDAKMSCAPGTVVDATGARVFYGKYRGTVVNNTDPLKLGRIQAMVPDVSNVALSSWALPCVPVTGPSMGVSVVPPIGAGVWMEFEQGNPDYPIWTGGFWGTAAEVPAVALTGNPASPSLVLQSGGQHAVIISDLAGPTGGITLKSTGGAAIIVNDTGIYIQTGQGASIVLTSSTVNINNGALSVT